MKFNEKLSTQGISEKEYIDYLRSINISTEKIKSLYSSIKDNIEQIIKNDLISFNQPINIKFLDYDEIHVDDFKIINAVACKKSENDFEILIFPGLVKELYMYARFVVSYGKIFKSIKRNNKNIEPLVDSVFFFWLDFVFFHEYFHIIMGHLDLDIVKSFKIHEIEKESELNEIKDLQKEIYIALEAEADGKAAEGSFIRFLLNRENLYNYFGVKCSDEEKIFDYLLLINFLFEWFMKQQIYNRTEALHPSSLERLCIVTHFIEKIEFDKHKSIEPINNIGILVAQAIILHQSGLSNDASKFADDFLAASRKIEYFGKILEENVWSVRKKYLFNSKESNKKIQNKMIQDFRKFIKIENLPERKFFGLITLNSKSLSGRSNNRRRLYVNELCSFIYEEFFSTYGKLSIVLPSFLFTTLIVFLETNKIINKLDELTSEKIKSELGLVLVATSKAKCNTIEVIKEQVSLLNNGNEIIDLEDKLRKLVEMKCVSEDNGIWLVIDVIKIEE